ncbi:MAG TPA: ABC transporter substrate-binding protein [Stellaceae bacterium]|nr:ABC transporter substrate-binding protein [Stellaceae bacterium]
MKTSLLAFGAAAACGALLVSPAMAQKKYGPGASDTEIVLGQTMAYSGPASAYGTIGKAEAAYFDMINAQGGVNGRKIKFLTLDDGYSPPKTVEQTRRLIEQDNILADFSSLGTPTDTAIHKYLNQKKVPHIFIASGATKWGDPQNFPWSMGWQPTYQTEGHIYAKYILQHMPNAKIGILYQDDDYGKDYVKGMVDGLGGKAKTMIVKQVSYETTDPSVESQIISLQASGANVFFNVTTPKFAAQAIRKAHDIGWHPTHFLNSVSNSVGAVLKPAGLDASKGLLTVEYLKDPTDPAFKNDKGNKQWLAWMDKYYPSGDKKDIFNVFGYSEAETMVQVLKQCGDNLTRENVMKQAANLHLSLPMLLPGITINTSATDWYPIKEEQLAKFDGTTWVRFGGVIKVASK